jgi:hypothetical protein
MKVSAAAIMTTLGTPLVSATPGRPVQDVGEEMPWHSQQGDDQTTHFLKGERDPVIGYRHRFFRPVVPVTAAH